jgi:hypothetical protein
MEALPAAAKSTPLAIERLQPLRLQRGRAVSAASGLVCAQGRAYVVGDDDVHLSEFTQAHAPGRRHRLRAGRLPKAHAARKAAKPDFECLLHWPRALPGGVDALVSLGSGSRPTRCHAVVLPLMHDGQPGAAHAPVNLAALYDPLRAQHGALNIEGAFLQDDAFVLLNRGVAGAAPNAAFVFDAQAVHALLLGGVQRDVLPRAVHTFDLGTSRGTPLAFTDGKALPASHGGWLFSAAAEDRSNSYDDGACRGSVLGVVDRRGRLQQVWPMDTLLKVEGIDWRQEPGGSLAVFMVTDADDATQPAWLLSARLPFLGAA